MNPESEASVPTIAKTKGGKRKVNKSLKAWVSFVKRVQKEEKLDYKSAIKRAKVRKDKGEQWMKGGSSSDQHDDDAFEIKDTEVMGVDDDGKAFDDESVEVISGGKRHRRTKSKSRRTRRRTKSRKHRSSRRRRGSRR